jgi:RHS repeat-associated protein
MSEQTGTDVMLMAADGTPRENNRVYPFGEPWNSFAASDNNEKFTTYQHDSESELDYAMARSYASRSGRFMSADPGHVGANLGNPQSWNAYVYVDNNPINETDPLGLAGEDPPKKSPDPYDAPCLTGFEPSCPNVPGGPAPPTHPIRVISPPPLTLEKAAPCVAIGTGALVVSGTLLGGELGLAGGPAAEITVPVGAAIGGIGALIGAGTAKCMTGASGGDGGGADKEVTFKTGQNDIGHGARHLKDSGLPIEQVERLIRRQIQEILRQASSSGSFWGKVIVNGQTIQYHAFTLPNGTINVGTYYIP